MLPAWALAHVVLLFRVLPGKSGMFGELNPGSLALLLALALLSASFASYVAYQRAHTLGWARPGWIIGVLHVPFVGAGLALWLSASGDEADERQGSPTAMAGRLAVPFLLAMLLAALLIAGIQALEDRQLLPFGLKQAGGYFGLAVFAGLPFAVGVTTGVKMRRAGGSFAQAHSAAFTLLGAVLLMLCGCAMEGIICVIMAAPFGAGITFVGASLGYVLAKQRIADGRLQSAAWLSIVAMVAIEGWNPPAPLEDTATTEIIIHAPAERVWAQLHDLRDLPPSENIFFRFGVAHPMGTATDGQGVGAARLCKLSTGDMPEVITVWKPGQELRFKVLSTPPSMRELGFFGQTIDATHLHSAYASLEGGFTLEALPGGRTRLTGDSRYLLNLSPAPYWNLWTKEIVHAVHRRVLEHVKSKAEAGPRP
jgi:hypothetical protein